MAAGFVAELVAQPSEDVDEGLVIGFADGDPGDQAPKGSTIRLVVSSGDEFEMPDLRGQPYADAVAALEAAGLDVRTEHRHRRRRRAGRGHPHRPERGRARSSPATAVTVVVAVDQVEVPELRGDSLEEATADLEDVGLTVGQVTGPGDGRVLGTWPLEGSEVTSGTPVALMMRPRR